MHHENPPTTSRYCPRSRRLHLGLIGGLTLTLSSACGGDPGAVAAGSGGGSSASANSSATTGGGGSDAGPTPAPGLQIVDLPMPLDLTPDGSTALLEDSAVGDVYLYDTASGQLTKKTNIGDPGLDQATKISATQRITAAHDTPIVAGVWSQTAGWTDLGSVYPTGCDPYVGGAYDISADGSVVVGLLWNGCSAEAFRWTDTGGTGTLKALTVLGSTAPGSTGPPTNRASVVSDDGTTAAGFAENDPIDRTPAIWNADGTGFLLDPTEMNTPAEVLSISHDGKMVAGVWGKTDGFTWTKETGMVKLGPLPGTPAGQPVYANAIAAGAQLVFGGVGDPYLSPPTAFVWTSAKGMRPLQDLVTASGISIPAGLQLTVVMSASTDGSVLLGVAIDATNKQQAFVLRMPVSAYGLP